MRKNFEILKMSAEWCGPCQATKPTFETFSTNHPDIFCRDVNVDVEGDLAKSYEVRSIPTLIFLKDGQVVKRHTGAFSLAQIEELASSAFGVL